jgi:hypothetical protein
MGNGRRGSRGRSDDAPARDGRESRREGAGHEPEGPCLPAAAPPALRPGSLALVTLELRRGLPDPRRGPAAVLVGWILADAEGRFGLRVLEHSLHSDHVFLIVRARSAWVLWRGVQGLCVRLERRLNRLWARTGAVFAERYEVREFATRRARRSPGDPRPSPETGGARRSVLPFPGVLPPPVTTAPTPPPPRCTPGKADPGPSPSCRPRP